MNKETIISNKQMIQKGKGVLFAIHLISALCYSIFMISQTNLITQLENNKLQYNLLFLTIVFLAIYIVSEIIEASYKEQVFSCISTSMKAEKAQQYLQQSRWQQVGTGDEKHIAFFQNKIPTVLLQHEYLGLYLQKQIVLFVFSIATLLFLSWPCFVAIVVVLALSGLVSKKFSVSVQKKQSNFQKEAASFSNYVLDTHQSFDEIHLQQMDYWAMREFSKKNELMENAKYRYQRMIDRVQSITVSQNMTVYIFILLIGASLSVRGLVGIGIFISCAELSVFIINSWSSMQNLYIKRKGSETLRKEIETAFPVSKDYRIPGKNNHVVMDIQGISFGFDKERCLWSDLSFSLDHGQKALVIGPSGSGKSTLLKVLSGFYTPQCGKISCTDKMVYVPQTPFLFEGTLKENLIFDRSVEECKIISLLEKLKLSMSLDSRIEENGRNLSGGQCARIAIARALLYEPELLLLDEITAQLDEKLGKEIEFFLLNEYHQTAMIFVSHRTYFREMYDQVININEYRKND